MNLSYFASDEAGFGAVFCRKIGPIRIMRPNLVAPALGRTGMVQ